MLELESWSRVVERTKRIAVLLLLDEDDVDDVGVG